MEKNCKCCEQWQEHYYWSHLSPKRTQFFKIMDADSSTRLELPKKFVDCCKGLLPKTLDLIGPSNKTWKVELVKVADDVFMQSGWIDFVEAHGIVEEDLLVFKYNGNCCFVSIFEESGCEKVSACFTTENPVTREETEDDSVVILNTSPSDLARKGSSSSDHASRHQATPPDWEFRSSTPVSRIRGRRSMPGTLGKRSAGEEPLQKKARNGPCPTYCMRERLEKHEELTVDDLYISNKTRLTEEEKSRVLQVIYAVEPDSPFFVSIMQPSHVHRRYFMAIACGFVREHLPLKNQNMILQLPCRTRKWTIGLLIQRRRTGFLAGFSEKWNKFVCDNHLEIGDICVFEMVQRRKPATLTVHIFRRGEEFPNVSAL